MTYITNDCLAYFLYKKLKQEYHSPFIGSLFESDEQYLKFCLNYDDYINQEPRFDTPLLPMTKLDYDHTPVMFLGDIEIHWPHESKGVNHLLEKFNRRKQRLTKPLFVWSDMQMFNGFKPELKQQFQTLNHIFVNKDDIPNFKDKSLEEVGPGHLKIPKWFDYNALANFILNNTFEDIHLNDHFI